MPRPTLLQNEASRRGVLRTGAKVAYATPLVLATMKAAPVFAQDIQADLSEDLRTEPTLEADLNDISNQIINDASAVTVSMVNTAQNALVAFENDYQAIITQVELLVPTGTQLGTALINPVTSLAGNVALPSPVPSGLPGTIIGNVLATTNTVADAVAVYNAYYNQLATALNNLVGNPTDSTLQKAFSNAKTAFTFVEDTVEGALLTLAGSAP